MAKDALNSEKLNIGVGVQNKVIRPGHYIKDVALIQQSTSKIIKCSIGSGL